MATTLTEIRTRRRRPRRLRFLTANTERTVGLLALGLLVCAFVLVPAFSVYGSQKIVAEPNAAPSVSHLFGTDNLGRDVFTRAFAGGRIDLLIAALTVLTSLAVGTAVGVMIGLTRSRFLGTVGLRVIDSVLAIPFVILVLSLVIVLGAESRLLGLPEGVGTVALAIVLVDWAVYARIARSQAAVLRDREFVEAARLLRYSRPRILFRHVVPNVLPTTASYGATDAVLVILGVASLAFLGSGIQEPTPELGNIMYQGHNYLATSWWITVLPGLVLVALGASLALIGDSFSEDD
ncbi:MAG: ABC transporter permease [Actinobacteria bacterium]|nr:ABC transporter permease [Actinomycetota bacterium]